MDLHLGGPLEPGLRPGVVEVAVHSVRHPRDEEGGEIFKLAVNKKIVEDLRRDKVLDPESLSDIIYDSAVKKERRKE